MVTGTDPWRVAVAEEMTEAELLTAVRGHIRQLGLWSYHTHRSDRSDAGFPDLVIVGRNKILYRELKTQTGRIRAEQTTVIGLLAAAGADIAIWRPADLLNGRILEELLEIAGRRPL